MLGFFTKRLSIRQDLLITIVNGVLVMLGVLYLNGFIARRHGLDVLGEFTLIKRTVTSIAGVLLLGMNVGLPYFLGKRSSSGMGNSAPVVFISFTVPVLILLTLLIQHDVISGFASDHSWVYFIFAIGICTQFLTYSLFRGHLIMIAANGIQLLGTVLIPVFFFSVSSDLYVTLLRIGVATGAVMIAFYLLCNRGFSPGNIELEDIRKLVKYGTVRIPSFACQFILIAGMPLFVVRYVDMTDLAFINSSISLIRFSLLIVTPISMILLPRLSGALEMGKHEKIREGITQLLTVSIFFSVLATLVIFLSGKAVLTLWLGQVTPEGARTLETLILALPFYTIIGVSRSLIDAASPRGYNSRLYTVAAIVLIGSFELLMLTGSNALNAGIYAFVGANLVAFIYCLILIKKLYGIRLFHRDMFPDLFLNAAAIVAVHHLFAAAPASPMVHFAAFISCGTLITGLYLWRSQKGWVRVLKHMMWTKLKG